MPSRSLLSYEIIQREAIPTSTPSFKMSESSANQRLQSHVLWALLRWEGELRNKRVREVLGLKIVQASRLLAHFAKEHIGAVNWRTEDRSWRVSRDATAISEAGGLEAYLSLTNGDPERVIIDARPDFFLPPPSILAPLTSAIRRNRQLLIRYRSMTTPNGRDRRIVPTAIVCLSQRWHVRAWCFERQEYRDFNLGRIAQVGEPEPVEQKPPNDLEWDASVHLLIAPHRSLDPATANMISREYLAGQSVRRVKVRGVLAHYVLQEARVAIDAGRETPPAFLLELLNADDITPYLFTNLGHSNPNK